MNHTIEYDEPIGGELPVASITTLEAITRAEIDMQVSTAKQYPRKISEFIRDATEIATIDEETAESCIYNRPVGSHFDPVTKKKVQDYADGMSIRMAEIVATTYGNIRVGSMIIEQTDRLVRARGFCHDLERNVMQFAEVPEVTVTSAGQPYSERMRIVVAKAALRKAERDATFKVIPRALCRPIERKVRAIIAGDGSTATITQRRAKVMTWLMKLGIDINRVYAALGISGESDIGIEELEKLTGIKTTLADKEITVDEAFPPIVESRSLASFGSFQKSSTPSNDKIDVRRLQLTALITKAKSEADITEITKDLPQAEFEALSPQITAARARISGETTEQSAKKIVSYTTQEESAESNGTLV
jgi:hypothetical protein